jgi:hypothetical protein
LSVAGLAGWLLYPHDEPRALPSGLIAVDSAPGIARLEGAEAFADYQPLSNSYQAQILASYCGVASSVSVLNALGVDSNQADFFTAEASQVRTQFEVVFGGMSLPELTGLLLAYGMQVSATHASRVSLEEFRDTLRRNLMNKNDFIIVNYQREVLGQGRVGHISPVAAYDEDTDSVLVMDTAAHKYPPTWVPVEMLYAAMQTKDDATGKTRGYIEVSR